MNPSPPDAMKALDQQAADQKEEAESQARYFQALQVDNAKLKQAATTIDQVIANDDKTRANLKARRDALRQFADGAAAPTQDVQAKIDAYEKNTQNVVDGADKAAKEVDTQQKNLELAQQSVTAAEAAFTTLSQRDTTIAAKLDGLDSLQKQAAATEDPVKRQLATYVLQQQAMDPFTRDESFDPKTYSDALDQAWTARAAACSALRDAQQVLDKALYKKQKTADDKQKLTSNPVDVLLATPPAQAEKPLDAN